MNRHDVSTCIQELTSWCLLSNDVYNICNCSGSHNLVSEAEKRDKLENKTKASKPSPDVFDTWLLDPLGNA